MLKGQKQPLEVFYKKSVLRNFAKFTGNTFARDSFLIKLQAEVFLLKTPFLQTSGQLLLKVRIHNALKLSNIDDKHSKIVSFNNSILEEKSASCLQFLNTN